MTVRSALAKHRTREVDIPWWTPGVTETHEGRVTVLGVGLYYRSFGRSLKGTVLGLHGGPGCGLDYMLPLADLAPLGYRVVLYDQVGCGRSDRPRGAKYYTERHAVEEVEAVRRALRLERVHLVGSSYGGALALDVALTYPNALKSLVISSGFASLEQWARENSKLYSRLPQSVRRVLKHYSSKGDVFDPKFLAAMDVYWQRYGCRLAVWPFEGRLTSRSLLEYQANVDLNPLSRMQGWDVTDRLPEIAIPTLITGGRYDHVPIACLRTIHRGIPGSRLVIFPNGSHMPMWENRVEFAELLRDFLEDVKDN